MNLFHFSQNRYFVNPPFPQNSTHYFEDTNASSRRANPQKLIFFLSIIIALFFAACSEDPAERGSITLTATHDCDIRLFDSQGRQIARENYEVGKEPVIIKMQYSGVFIIHAVSSDKTVKEPITFHSGHIEHYIEF